MTQRVSAPCSAWRRSALLVSLLTLLMALTPSAQAQDASVVRDIWTGDQSTSSLPLGFAEITVNGTPTALFAATRLSFSSSNDVGRELFRTDGTRAGTQLVANINPGDNSSSPRELVVLNNRVYFTCETSTTGRELCVSDGTSSGTQVLADIRVGPNGSNIFGLTVVGTQLFFFANDGTNGLELWVSDGTTTQMVENIGPGSDPLNRSARSNDPLLLTGRYAGTTDTFYFMANDGMTGLELWASDGSAAGTRNVKDIEPGQAGPQRLQQFTGVGSRLFFEADKPDNTFSTELWVSDGTDAGTVALNVLGPDTVSEPQSIADVGGEAYFFAYDDPDAPTYALYRSDGATVSTVVGGLEGISVPRGTSFIYDFDGRAAFRVYNPTAFRGEFWIANSAGTSASKFSDIRPEFSTSSSRDYRPAVLNGFLYFVGSDPDGNFGEELYRTDGTTAGTQIVADVVPDGGSSDVTDIGVLGGSQILFGANDQMIGNELWAAGAPTAQPPPEEELSVTLDARLAVAAGFCTEPAQPSNCPSVGAGRSDTLEVGAGQDVVVDYVVTNTGTVTITAVDVTDPFLGAVVQDEPVSISPGGSETFTRVYAAPTVPGLTTGRTETVASDVNGATAFDAEGIGLDVQGPRVDLEVRVAKASTFCSDPSDVTSCRPLDTFEGGEPVPDTVVTDPLAPVLVRYVVDNIGITSIADLDLEDPLYGPVVSNETVNLAPEDSAVYQRIYTAPVGVGIADAVPTVTARDNGGNAVANGRRYGIEIPAPRVDLDVRVARAADFCSDPSDVTSCRPLDTFEGGEPVPDTVVTDPLAPVLVRYVVDNIGITSIADLDLEDPLYGPVATAETVNLAPGDSAVYQRIYPAPTVLGIAGSVPTVTARDNGGNAVANGRRYGIEIPAPRVDLDVRIAKASTFCSDTSDVNSCRPLDTFEDGMPVPDTVVTSPLAPVLVRYVVDNIGITSIADLDVEDPLYGPVATAETVNLAPGDSAVYQRIYPAPTALGIADAVPTVTARDDGGNAVADSRRYGIEIPAPRVDLDVRIAKASTFCSDTSDVNSCRPLDTFEDGAPLPDTVVTDPLAPVLVRYTVDNRGLTPIAEISIEDDFNGTVVSNETVNLAPGDSVFYQRIYPAPTALGITSPFVLASAEDDGGNTTADGNRYGIEILPPRVRMDVLVARASDVCSDPTNVNTCRVTEFDNGQPRRDTVFAINRAAPFAVRYAVYNRGFTTLQSVAVTDQKRGSVLDRPTVNLAPTDSIVVTRLYPVPVDLPAGIDQSRVDVITADAGGNGAINRDAYGVQPSGTALRLSKYTAPASQVCNNINNAGTCSVERLRDFLALRGTQGATAAKAEPQSERSVVLYGLINVGTADLTRHTLTDGAVGTIFEDSTFTVEALTATSANDSVGVFRIFDAVSRIGAASATEWSSADEDGEETSAESVSEPPAVALSGFAPAVRDQSVALTWSAVFEDDADRYLGFEVQQFDANAGPNGGWQVLDLVERQTESTEYRYATGPRDPDVYRFRLRLVETDGQFAVSEEVEALINIEEPYRFTAVSPSPVRASGRFSITVREAQPVRIDAYDLLGRRVATVFDGLLEAGREQNLTVETSRLASGLYFLRAAGRDFSATQRMVVVR